MGTVYPNEGVGSPPESLEDLYADYRERLLHFVMSKVGVDSHAAEDIVQEAFTAALMSFAGFQFRSSPYTWLCSIAQHKIADYYRRQYSCDHAESLSLDELAAEDEPDDPTATSIERWLEAQETRDVVQRALRRLPPMYSEVLRLKYFAGLSVNEISHKIGRTPKAVEGLLARARRTLSQSLSEAVQAR
jgi:RNA polymerase sigma-70 factor (ECF subfamily)